MTAREATWEIDTPGKPMSTDAKPRLTLVFEGLQFPMLLARANTSSTLRLVSKQSRSSEYLNLYFVLRQFKRSYETKRINCESYVHKFCAVDIFWNITRQLMYKICKIQKKSFTGYLWPPVSFSSLKLFLKFMVDHLCRGTWT